MGKKFSVSEKWSDPWVRKLSKDEKLLFTYLCDVCDCAGFVEHDIELFEFHLKATTEELEGALKGLYPKVVRLGSWLWVVNHIKHQQDYPNKPLNPANKAHRGIWSRLNAHLDMEEVQAFIERMDVQSRAGFIAINGQSKEGATKGLPSPPSKGTSKGIGKEEGGPGGEVFLRRYEKFIGAHADCAKVKDFQFQNSLASWPGADVDEALDSFCRHVAGARRLDFPLQKFENHLSQSRKVAVEQEIEKTKKKSRRHPALRGGA